MEDRREMTAEEPQIEYEKLFRSAMFGFHKEDVLSYLERLARTRRKESERYASHIRGLESELEQLRAAQSIGVAASENEALRSENALLRMRLTDLEAASAEKTDTPADAPADFPAEKPSDAPADAPAEKPSGAPSDAPAERQQALERRLRESEDARARLEDKLREYELEKARLGEIEENAHQRARAIEVEAQDRSAQLRTELSRQAAALRVTLDELTAHIDETSRSIYTELSASGTRYAALRRETDEMRALLERFSG